MKNTNNNSVKKIRTLVLILTMVFSTSLFAVPEPIPGPPQGTEETVDNGSSDSIPLDGGLAILLAGAAFFGIKKLRAKKNN